MAKKKRMILEINASELVEIGSPDLFFSTQQALQNEGISLVDLDTGDLINGQVNISDIGLIDHHKPPRRIHQMGYVQPTEQDQVKYAKADLDAVLVFDPANQIPKTPTYFLIRVVEDDNLDFWTNIALNVAKNFVIRDKKKLYPQITFGVTSLSRGVEGDSSARNTALRKIRSYALDSLEAISDSSLIPEDDFFDEEDEDEGDGDECNLKSL